VISIAGFLFLLVVPQGAPTDIKSLRLHAVESPHWPGCHLPEVKLADGILRVRAVGKNLQEVERERTITEAEVSALLAAISKAEFFSLPDEMGCLPTYTVDKDIDIELAGRRHAVKLYEPGNDPFCQATPAETDRGFVVWKAIQALAAFAVSKECRGE
jgi:hypothetical protein